MSGSRPQFAPNGKAQTMKITMVSLLVGLGMAASAVPSLASPASSGILGQDSLSDRATSIQYTRPAQLGGTGEYNGRSEDRDGNFKRTKKSKKK